MDTDKHGKTRILVSDRLYRRLLLACPKSFREEYGPHMAQLFRDQCRDVYGESGAKGMVWLWVTAVFDLGKTAVSEHIWEVSHMSNRRKLTSQEQLVVLTPLLVFVVIFIMNPGYVGELFAQKEPFIIVPFLPCGWFVAFLAVGFMLAGYYFLGTSHGDKTIQFRDRVLRSLAILMLLLASTIFLLGPAWFQVTRTLN